jgi:hypothetical protein
MPATISAMNAWRSLMNICAFAWRDLRTLFNAVSNTSMKGVVAARKLAGPKWKEAWVNKHAQRLGWDHANKLITLSDKSPEEQSAWLEKQAEANQTWQQENRSAPRKDAGDNLYKTSHGADTALVSEHLMLMFSPWKGAPVEPFWFSPSRQAVGETETSAQLEAP